MTRGMKQLMYRMGGNGDFKTRLTEFLEAKKSGGNTARKNANEILWREEDSAVPETEEKTVTQKGP